MEVNTRGLAKAEAVSKTSSKSNIVSDNFINTSWPY